MKNQEYNKWLDKLLKDMYQNRYNLIKENLYNGILKDKIEEIITILKDDYDM